MVAVENAVCAFSKELVGALLASTAPAASTDRLPWRTIRTNSATWLGVPMPARASSACRRLAPRPGEPCTTSSGTSRGERQYKGDAVHGTAGAERSARDRDVSVVSGD